MKELYDNVIEAYKSGDENKLIAAARNWCEAGGENPFKQDTKEFDLYFTACRAYRVWQSRAINANSSKKRMVNCIKQIAELDLPNPYNESLVKPKKKQPVHVVKEEPEHILGVLPEDTQNQASGGEKKHFFAKRKKGEKK